MALFQTPINSDPVRPVQHQIMGTFMTWEPTRISTTPATRPWRTGILHKTLSKGLSPNLGQTKTQTPAVTILGNEDTKYTYCFPIWS